MPAGNNPFAQEWEPWEADMCVPMDKAALDNKVGIVWLPPS